MQRLVTHFPLSYFSVALTLRRVGVQMAVALGIALVSSLLLSSAPTIAQARVDTFREVQPEHQAASSSSAASQKNEDILLETSKPVERELAGGEIHTYRINLRKGQFLRAVIDQRGVNVVVTLSGPGGEQLLAVDLLGSLGPEPISFEAEKPGTYRLQVQSLAAAAVSGRYGLVSEVRASATQQDKDRLAAERLLIEADELEKAGTEESLRRWIEKGEQALILWRKVTDKFWEAYTLNSVGRAYDFLFKKEKALEFYNQALPLWKAVGDRRAEAATLHNIGIAYESLGEPRKALEFFNRALPLKRAVGVRSSEANTLGSIGNVYVVFGEHQKALEFFNQALSLWRTVGDRKGEAGMLMGIGAVYYSLGEPQKALEFYNQALPLARAVGDRGGEADIYTNIGNVYSSLGEWQKALDSYDRALEIVRAINDRVNEPSTLGNIGYVYNSLGESQKALEFYNRALLLARAIGDRGSEASKLHNIGGTYDSLGEPQKALEFYNQALPLWKAVGDRSGEANTLRSIGIAYKFLGEHQKALEFYNQALPLMRAVGERGGEAKTLVNIGQVYGSLGEHQKALEFFNQALPLARAVGHRNSEAQALYQIARSERDRGNLVEANKGIEASLAIIESLRTKVVSQELRASFFETAQGFYEFYVDLLMRLHQQHPSAGHDAAALQASERGRARSLLETLAEAGADIRQGVDPKLVERERSLQQRLNAKAQRKMQLLNGPHTPEQAKAIGSEIEALTTELQQVEAHIRQTSPRYATLTQPQPLALGEIQSLLDPDTVLLEYALGTEQSYVWVVTPDALATHKLAGWEEIETLALQTYELLTARNRSQKSELPEGRRRRIAEADALYWRTAAELSQLILTPVAAHLKDKRLIVVADGALQKIPFGALPSPKPSPVKSPSVAASGTQSDAGARQTAGGMRPLIIDHEIVNLPSASVLASLRREATGRVPSPKAVAVFADPVFDKADTRLNGKIAQMSSKRRPAVPYDSVAPTRRDDDLDRTLRSTGTADDSLSIPRLFASRREAEAIAALAPPGASLKALGFDANRSLATDVRMRQYRIIHFATHALVNYEHPGLSGLILSLVDERGAARDGFLRLHDIFNLRLNADLVVLSACNTGLGKDIRGEGLVGLTRGFMYAGSPRVIASLWKVDDDATASLMRRTYQRMLAGRQSPAAALRGAQVEMWQQKNQSAPYYWAAFTLQGEWR